MSKTQYGLVLVVAMVAGLIGGAVSSRLLPARVLRAMRFEAVDKRGKIRVTLDKAGLVFFPREGEIAPVALDTESASLRLYGYNAGDRLELSAAGRFLRLSDAEGKIIWEVPERVKRSETGVPQGPLSHVSAYPEVPAREPSAAQIPPPPQVAAESPVPRKKVPHPACSHCFTYDCPECYTVFEEVPDTEVIIPRQIPNPAPGRPQGVQLYKRGQPMWYIGNQPYIGPTDEEPFSPELPIPLIELERLQARHQKEISSIPGVQGFGIGAKGFVVFLLPEKRENASQVPKVLEGVPVEVKLGGPFEAL